MAARKINLNSTVTVQLNFDVKPFIERVMDLRGIQAGQFEFNFIDNDEIRQLNKQYLGRDLYTDILTFNLEDNGQPMIGDVYISVDQARENAGIFGNSFDEEIRLLLVHGILHLLGYTDYSDDEKAVMNAEQARILAEIGLL
jgi:rRNA maturation RNase YbeY